jgi:hypothetical protein
MVSFFMDGFRSLAYVDKCKCRLISRSGNQFKSFPALAESLHCQLLVLVSSKDSQFHVVGEQQQKIVRESDRPSKTAFALRMF